MTGRSSIPLRRKKGEIRASVSPALTAKTPTPSRSLSLANAGNSSRHGAHQVAQKATTTALPGNASNVVVPPPRIENVVEGAMTSWPTDRIRSARAGAERISGAAMPAKRHSRLENFKRRLPMRPPSAREAMLSPSN
jgi:hypothetical protein